MRESITRSQRAEIVKCVRLARAAYREAERHEQRARRILAPTDGPEWVNVDDAILSATANEMNSVAETLRSLGVKVSRR